MKRLSILLVAVALGAGAVGWFSKGLSWNAERRVQAEAADRDLAERLARDATGRVSGFIDGIRLMMQAISTVTPVREFDHRPCTELLLAVRQGLPPQMVLGVSRGDGWLICSTAGTPERLVNVGRRSFFAQTYQQNEFFVSEWEAATQILRGGTLHFGQPIRSPAGTPIGVHGGAVGVTLLVDLLRPMALPQRAQIMLVDRLGNIVIHVRGDGIPAQDGGIPPAEPLRAVLPPFPMAAEPGQSGEGSPRLSRLTGAEGQPNMTVATTYVPGTKGALRLLVLVAAETVPSSGAAVVR